MRLLAGFILSVALLFTLCSCRVTIPQTAEDVGSFDDVLAFLAETTETEVEGITLDLSFHKYKEDPLVLSDADTNTLLTLLTEMNFTWEGYEPLEQYGAYSYELQIHLPEEKVVSLTVEEDYIHCCRQEKNAEGKWTDVSYRLVPTDTADTKAIYNIILQLWDTAYTIPPGESRTVQEMLGEEIEDAREIILHCDLDGKSGDEICLYVWTDQHPEPLTALTELSLVALENVDDTPTKETISVSFYIGEDDYRYGKDILRKEFKLMGNTVDLCLLPTMQYKTNEDEPGAFAVWLKEWMEENKDTDGVKIVRYEND